MAYPSTRIADILKNITQTVGRNEDVVAFSMNGVVAPQSTVSSLIANNVDFLFIIFVSHPPPLHR